MSMYSGVSAVDLSAKARQVAQVDSNGKINVATANTHAIIGLILDGGLASGDGVSVAGNGEIAWAIASTSITPGAWLTAATGGKVVTTTTDTNMLLGRALTTAGADGDFVLVMIALGTFAG